MSSERHALVTGSSSGIGQAIAKRLLADGWRVTGVDVAPATSSAPAFRAVSVELADSAALEQVLATLLDDGAPHAFVHAAGMLRAAPLGALAASDGQAMWQVHVAAATRIGNALLPAMAKAGRGRAVLIGSRVSRGTAGRSQYAACKAALGSLARSWAAEVVTAGVTVNVVSPGATDTPMLSDPARGRSSPRLPPIGRLVQPVEIAAAVAFLLSDDAAAITGQDLVICGGASLDLGRA